MRISDWSSDVCSSDLWRIDRRAVVPCIAAIARIRLELGVVLEVEIVELRLLRHVSNQAVESGATKQRALRAFQHFHRRHVERVRVKLHLGNKRKIGRAAGRERMGQYVKISEVAGTIK